MEILSLLGSGFGVALQPLNIMLLLTGCFVGTLVGALPGPWAGQRGGGPDPADLRPSASIRPRR